MLGLLLAPYMTEKTTAALHNSLGREYSYIVLTSSLRGHLLVGPIPETQ